MQSRFPNAQIPIFLGYWASKGITWISIHLSSSMAIYALVKLQCLFFYQSSGIVIITSSLTMVIIVFFPNVHLSFLFTLMFQSRPHNFIYSPDFLPFCHTFPSSSPSFFSPMSKNSSQFQISICFSNPFPIIS